MLTSLINEEIGKMKAPKLIAQGAESKLFLIGNKILKNRFAKKYRIQGIDDRLRKSRTRREAKAD